MLLPVLQLLDQDHHTGLRLMPAQSAERERERKQIKKTDSFMQAYFCSCCSELTHKSATEEIDMHYKKVD